MKRTFGIFLVICLLITLLPAPALAADEIEIEGIFYTIENQEAIITGYDKDALYEFEDYWTRTFVIPETVNGAPVTRVAEGAFDRSPFRALSFPASLRVVGNGAFTNCGNLSNITFCEGLTEIGAYCFDGSGSLRTLQLPSTLRTLGYEAFSESGLAAIDLPEGLNVISPTWFSLRGNEGEFEDFSSADYVSKAHGKGLQVWALLDNLDESVTLGEVLKRTSVRRALAENLVGAVKACGADGINVDFELLRKDAARQYLQFIRELSVFCRNSGLVLSVDVPNPAAYNLHYDRRELGEVCDYVVNMGYDEHTSGDDPGSTASIGFFRRGLTETLEEIPPEALIGGVPFYTRAWTVSGGEVQSRALTMEGAQNWVEEHDAGLNWDEECGQYYAEKESSGGTVSMLWMEDARSLELKFSALKTSRAAGVACWRLGTETADVWKVLFSSFLK